LIQLAANDDTDPANGILRAITDNNVDLIIAGALEKESALHPFLGNVARRLLRESSCSVVLFTHPELEPKPLRRIVFVVNYSDHAQRAFKQALKLAQAESSADVVRETADVFYMALVALARGGGTLADVRAELARRHRAVSRRPMVRKTPAC